MVSVGTRAALLGRHRPRSLATLAGAWLLAVAVFGIASGLRSAGGIGAALGPPGLAVAVLALAALAGASAGWNGGLAPSLSLVFGPAAAAFWHTFGRGGRPVETAAITLGAALVFSLPVGGAGYVVGRVTRALLVDAAGKASWGMRVLLGDDRKRVRWWLQVAAGLSVAAAGIVGLAHLPGGGLARLVAGLFNPAFLVGHGTALAVVVVLLWAGVAAWPASRGDGLIASWALVAGPVFGATLVRLVADGFGAVVVEASLAVLAATALALLLGTAGFLVGRGARRVRG